MRLTPTLTALFFVPALLAAPACDDGGGGDGTGVTDVTDASDTSATDTSVAEVPELPDVTGQIWVANRGSHSVTVIDAADDEVFDTIAMPDAGEPMYVNHSLVNDVVFVGDRANDRVIAFDAGTREVVRMIAVGEGVFHQWALPYGEQLWVNADVDKTTTVIDTDTYAVLATIDMPADLAGMSGDPKPHDVLIAPDGASAFVTYLGFEGDNDWIVRFDTATFAETHRAPVGKDPHVSATADNTLLYVPCQETDEVIIFKRADLTEVARVTIPGAHGAGMTHGGDRFYVTNLPDGGPGALFVMDVATGTLVSTTGFDAPMVGKPHNVALSRDDMKVYVTHSGPDADIVSVYEVSAGQPVPTAAPVQVKTGTNPFGLGFVAVASVTPPEEYTKVHFDVSELSTLRGGQHYEGWAVFDGQPVSTGKFNVDASGVATDLAGIAIPDGEFEAGRDLTTAQAFVITIEESGDVDIVPNDTHYLAGGLSGKSATLTVGHPEALGDDFTAATGAFILATPTNGADSDETSGVWFINLQMADPTPGLHLPTLPAGWAYEGWAVIGDTPVSTGKFLAADGADDAAPFSGTEAAPPFPGEDFLMNAPAGLTFPTNLSEAPIVVSIEPDPDDSADPFLLKPLVGAAPMNAADHQTFTMDNHASDLPEIVATLRN